MENGSECQRRTQRAYVTVILVILAFVLSYSYVIIDVNFISPP